jgi:type I restriction enzyme S subunit
MTMRPTGLADHLDLIASTPEGIRKLRGLILELAVRGKLVPQDPNDEPASELLKRIAKERARMEAEGECKKSKPLVLVGEDELPFDLPDGWEWARAANVTSQITDGTHHTPTYVDSGIPFLSVKDLSSGRMNFSNTRYISPEEHCELSKRCSPMRGDLLLTKVGTTGIAVLVDTDAAFSIFVSVALLKLPIKEVGSYLQLLVNSPFVKKQSDEGTEGVGNKNLVLRKISAFLLPIPPLAEQHRIVAKVDELMALCDELEQKVGAGETAHAKLVETLLGTLTQSTDAAELAAHWQRLAEHFDTLFTTEASLDALKQTVLQLAVMGKLVPQDPNDEPASELLKKIAIEKDRLSRDEGLRTTAEPHIEADEKYMDLPGGWQFQRLGNLAKFIDYRGRTPDKIDAGVPLITAKNVRFGFISRKPYEFVSEKEYTDWMTRGFPRIGDILFTTEAPLGNVAIVDINEKFALAQRVICFQFHEPQISDYLRLALMSELVRQQIGAEATGMTATGIKASRLKEIPVPLPPLAEQHRIVAKVDELMALCDRLKVDLAESCTRQERLATTLIDTALKAA